MTTQLQIGQMALAEIGTRSTITSSGATPNGTVFNDGSEEALYLDMYYLNVRNQALAAAYWNFAKITDTITLYKALPGTPENTSSPVTTGWTRSYPQPPWVYSYLPPANMLVARSLIAQPDISTISPPIFSTTTGSIAQPRALRVPFAVQIDPYDAVGAPQTPAKKVILTNAQTPLLEYTTIVDESLWEPEFVMVMVKALAAYVAIALTSNTQLAQMKIGDANNVIMEARRIDANEGTEVLNSVPDWLRIRGVGGNYSNSDFWYPYGPLFSLGGSI